MRATEHHEDCVREGGLEPPRPCGHRNLNPARLPIPPLAREQGSVPADAPRLPRVRAITIVAMGLQRFERRLERLLEGAFGKAFRSGLQPVEIGRRVVREMDAGRTLGVRGTVVPNRYDVTLSAEDMERFAGFRDALVTELVEAAREHARDENYHFEGPLEISLEVDDNAKRGDLHVRTEIVASATAPGSIVLPDGTRVALSDEPVTIGRLPDCAITLTDPQASREHATIRPDERGYRVEDLGSTNGVLVNGVRVREHVLIDGDVITIGATSLRYEES